MNQFIAKFIFDTFIHMEIILRQMTGADWPEVADIYKQGIDTGNATFRKEIPTAEDWDKGHIPTCRIVAVADNKVVGWAALTQVSGRWCMRE